MNSTTEKSLPASIEAEAATLGSILLNRDAIIAVAPWLKPAHFYLEKHAWIYEAALACYDAGTPPDTITISEELRKRNRLEAIGGYGYLNELDANLPTSYHIEYYAREVERTAVARNLIVVGGTIAALGYDEQHDIDAAISQAQAALDQVAGARAQDDGLVMLSDVVEQRYHEIEAAVARGDQVQLGVPTGWRDIDELLGGLQKSDLLILAARPSVGKSSWATSLAYAVGGAGHRVDIFSLEMSRQQTLDRLISIDIGMDLQQIRHLRLSDDGLRRYMESLGRINAMPIAIDDRAALNVHDIRARILRRQAKDGPPELVIIDYLQLMGGVRRADNRVQEVSEISRGLKQLAKELNVPILALSQLSRAVEGRTSHVPMLSDLRECVVGSTRLIDAASGRWVPISAVQQGDQVLGLDYEQRIGVFSVRDVWSTGVKPVYTLTTRTGRKITATANHPLLTDSGWKPLGVLRPGDVIATAVRLPEHGLEISDRAGLCRLLGYLVGDGTYQQHRGVGFISSDPETFDDVCSLIAQHFPGVRPRRKRTASPRYQEADFSALYQNGYGKPFGNPLREWLRSIGVVGQKDATKHIPDWVFEAGTIGAREFLAGYLSTDGCVKRHLSGAGWNIHFDTVSYALAEDVQALLLRIGVVAAIGKGYLSSKATQPLYRITVAANSQNLRQFAEQVPVRGKKSALLSVLRVQMPVTQAKTNSVFGLPKSISAYVAEHAPWRDQGKRMNRDACMGWAHYTGSATLGEWATSDVLWEDVRQIDPSGAAEVFDISIPGCGNFIGNGIVAHNSGALEQDADIVMFIYRPELYEKDDTDKKGIAEIHIAKHRNGPTAVIPMRFDANTTRFLTLTYRTPEGY